MLRRKLPSISDKNVATLIVTRCLGVFFHQGEKKKDGNAKEKIKKEVKVEPEAEPEPEDMVSTVKSRRLMSMQAKKEKEEMDRQNKGTRHLK